MTEEVHYERESAHARALRANRIGFWRYALFYSLLLFSNVLVFLLSFGTTCDISLAAGIARYNYKSYIAYWLLQSVLHPVLSWSTWNLAAFLVSLKLNFRGMSKVHHGK